MWLSLSVTLAAALASISVAALAIDTHVTEQSQDAPTLSKRATESIHFAYCNGLSDATVVIYCPEDSQCNQEPAYSNKALFLGIIDLEGKTKSTSFPTGVKLSWWLNPDARKFPTYQQVGTAWNDFGEYKCYKDDKHFMYHERNQRGSDCESAYYCLH